MDFVRDIRVPWWFRLGGICDGHLGTMGLRLGDFVCWKSGHHGGSDWVDFVRDLGAQWRLRLGGFCAGHWDTMEV